MDAQLTRSSDATLLSTIKSLVPSALRAYVRRRRDDTETTVHFTERSPDRRFLIDTLLPRLSAGADRVLWVGCRRYTQSYPAIVEAAGAQCWTLDIDQVAAKYGHPLRHVTADVRRAGQHFPAAHFGAIFLNGVFGYGVDRLKDQEDTVRALARLLRPGGLLQIGWNHDLVSDPARLAAIVDFFSRAEIGGLDARISYDSVTHVYDVFRKVSN